MTQQDKTQDILTSGQPPVAAADSTAAIAIADGQDVPSGHGRFVWLAIASIFMTVISWICAGYNAWAAIVVAAAAIVTGALALKSHRRGVRNTAITSIIAATVLLVVVAAFLIVIYIGLKAI